jgi:glutathione S-transferase
LKVSYELEIFHRNKETRLAPPELKKVHALGKSPVISVTPAGSTEPTVIAESAFIIEYLLDHFGNGSTLLPKRYKEGQEGKVGGETEEWLRFRYYMHYAEGSLMSLMLLALVVLSEALGILTAHQFANKRPDIKNSSVPFFIKPVTNGVASKIQSGFLGPNFKTHYTFLEGQLKTSPDNGQYLCGPNLTGADILLSFPLIAGKGRSEMSKEQYPKLCAYVDRLEAEPGYVKAAEKIKEIDGKFEATFKA